MSGTHYLASEDSALLRRTMAEFSGDSCLEIGAGNAGALVDLTKRFNTVVGTDLTVPAMTDWRGAGASFLLANGASCLRSSTFDLVAFNPPYIAEAVRDDPTVEGGERLEVPLMFFAEALRVVKPGGKILMLLNDEANLTDFRGICEASGFRMERVSSQRVFFEELAVYLASSANET
jgi:methylase of polypeptide subunit release factors